MKRSLKKKAFTMKPVILLIAAAVLLLASAVGSTQAALTYYSETYTAGTTLYHIGVTLTENDNDVSWRDYIGEAQWREHTGKLLENMLEENEELVLGKQYEEALSVRNTGGIDTYVRVVLTKSWQDANGVKNTTLSPGMIDLNILTEDNGWIIDESATTPERTVLYYTKVLPVGGSTPAFTDSISINPAIGTKVIETVETVTENGREFKTVTYTFEYDGYTFEIRADVDAVQTHNVAKAVKSAWGVDVTVLEEGILSLQREEVQE